uniref:Peptidoglycan recognition protein n=1 Tax=Timema genevievae TaxID=629358 RepID=A0A7R9PQP7_TIMGE|nr:unnamed protein product [Timema genevievae]
MLTIPKWSAGAMFLDAWAFPGNINFENVRDAVMVTCQQSKDKDAGDNRSYSSATAGVDLGSDWEDVSDTTSVFEDDDNDVHKEARVRSPTNTDEDIAEAVNIRRKRFETRPSYGNIAVNRSTDIHFGNKTYYNAPVTIKQYVNSNGGESGVYPGGASGPQDVSHRTDGGMADLHTKLHTEINLVSARRYSKDSCKHKDPSSKGYLQILLRGPRHCVLLSAALAVATAALLILVILLTVHKYDAQQVIAQTTSSPKDDEYESTFKYADTNTTLSGRLRILTRREWLAQPPLHPTDSLYHPVPYVIISHTATEPCVKQADCTFFVRTVQTFHIESFGWWDIGYNFLVGGDGYAYEGRGWNHVGAHALGYNNVSIGISIIGTFISVLPPDSQLLAAKQLIQRGVELGKVSPNYKLLGHRQVSATESPGTALYDEIKTWPNWVEKP